MLSWTPEDLGNKVYNDEYIRYDPDYVDIRPTNYAAWISKLFYPYKKFKHLDYGSGQGVMGSKLNSLYGWDSTSYDPYSANTTPSGVFKLITAIEVFEHSLDIDKTIKDIKKYLDPRKGVILFSTQLATKKHDISWWYIGARNGHISISSEESLKILAIRNNMFFSSLNEGVHVLQSSRDNLSSLRRDG
jgi:2-polyprenyl-6-hydroxyphenyl methylase/3-demethylubiquinone-9 3-methyltransferase